MLKVQPVINEFNRIITEFNLVKETSEEDRNSKLK